MISYVSMEKIIGTQMLTPLKSELYLPPNLWLFRGISKFLILIGTTVITIIYCNKFEKYTYFKIKMTIISTSSITIFSMLIALIIWKLNNFTNYDDQLLFMFITGSATFCLVFAILSKTSSAPTRYRNNCFKEKYGDLTAGHPTFHWLPETQPEPETYERRNSYENPYKTKTSSSKSYQRSQNNEESYKNMYK